MTRLLNDNQFFVVLIRFACSLSPAISPAHGLRGGGNEMEGGERGVLLLRRDDGDVTQAAVPRREKQADGWAVNQALARLAWK